MCLFYYCNFALGECKLYKGITNYIYNRYWGVQIPGSTYYILHRRIARRRRHHRRAVWLVYGGPLCRSADLLAVMESNRQSIRFREVLNQYDEHDRQIASNQWRNYKIGARGRFVIRVKECINYRLYAVVQVQVCLYSMLAVYFVLRIVKPW